MIREAVVGVLMTVMLIPSLPELARADVPSPASVPAKAPSSPAPAPAQPAKAAAAAAPAAAPAPATASAPATNEPAATNGQAYALMKAHKYPEAIAMLQRVVAASPKNKLAWSNLGACDLMMYECGLAGPSALADGLDAFQKMAALDASFHADSLAQAQEYDKQEHAWAEAAKAREGKPARVPAATGTLREYGAAADAAMQEGDFDLAAANYSRAREVATSDKGRSAAENWTGLALLKQRRPKDAAVHLRQATTLDPTNKFAWNNLGAALRRQYDGSGDLEALKECAVAIRKVNELDPDSHPENLAWVKAELAAAGIKDETPPAPAAGATATPTAAPAPASTPVAAAMPAAAAAKPAPATAPAASTH